jgi:hypothetical protein
VIAAVASPVIAAGGALLFALAIAGAWSSSRRSLPARTRWVLIAGDASIALMGVGVAVVPWARAVGAAIGLIGVLGRAYFGIWGLLLRGADRRAP